MVSSMSYKSEMHRLELELCQMFELSEEEEASLGPQSQNHPVQEIDSASVPCVSEDFLMQRIWGGETQVNWSGSDRLDENLEDKRTTAALKLIQQRFSIGNESLSSDEDSVVLQNRVRIIQLEEGIQKTKDLINQQEVVIAEELNDTSNINESLPTITESVDEDVLLSKSLEERLIQHQKEQITLMQFADEALQKSEKDFLVLDEQHCKLEELNDEVKSIKEELSDCNNELSAINQRTVELNEAKERKRREKIALQEQVTTLTEAFSDIRADQEEIDDGINELAERQSEVDKQYEEIQEQRNLEYPHLYATANLGNQLNRISSHVNTQVRAIPGFVKETSIFLWESFTRIAWKTIEIISNLGREIFQMTMKVCSYVIQKGEEIVVGWVSTPALVAMGAVSLSLLQTTGSPLAFGATAVSGYFLLRRLF